MKQDTNPTEGSNAKLTSPAASMARIKDGKAAAVTNAETDQEEPEQILRTLRDKVFAGSDEKLAVAVGRPVEEIKDWVRGEGTVDGDALQKAKALAAERDLEAD